MEPNSMMEQGIFAKLAVTITASILAASATAFVTTQRELSTSEARIAALEDMAQDNRRVTSDIRDQLGLIRQDVGEIKGEVKVLVGKEIYGRGR
jgi:hypothetical protein